ncbi:hypothetical protein PF005_g26425 [Phytophthora fragariae]|uniref:Uncharacterized protein n=1 Tax=Phytophthora fragariae TaxID=53985 RepID=A0A6A3Q9B8_9STRA|nr:hypothetical protein PF003_g16045 [Phytophthora fragariae]KAE8922548.1 hypothetical protein PF009_g27191 [Phytophthora fragariae]KAE9071604.1 hypothetical protein PF007_g26492 [Phytophthora fragariae]KAE9087115.1 hypothetical protein PF006_g25877 [Phytophthora fragariae]KAE9173087.1 hypothetical protein PF005_g26425 [Phytophthora fragariae]
MLTKSRQSSTSLLVLGTVSTQYGGVPAAFAADLDNDLRDSLSPGARITASNIIGTPRTVKMDTATPPTQNIGGTTTSRSAGRPRNRERQALTSAASPNCPILMSNPERSTTDAEELRWNRRLNISSDWLGGRDLRVLRDNFEEVGGRVVTNRSGPHRKGHHRARTLVQSEPALSSA